MPTKCFLVRPSPTLDAFLWLRRYSDKSGCPGMHSYHDNWTRIGVIPSGYRRVERDDDSGHDWYLEHNFEEVARTDPRWPAKCEKCDHQFADDDHWQNFTDRIYVADDGRTWPRRELPPGAIWFEDWLPKRMYWDNKEDQHLMVMLPNGSEWNIDSRASNCTMPDDRLHRCWVRTGAPPNITAGKQGLTCAAGAGSIQSGTYHGFLVGGVLS